MSDEEERPGEEQQVQRPKREGSSTNRKRNLVIHENNGQNTLVGEDKPTFLVRNHCFGHLDQVEYPDADILDLLLPSGPLFGGEVTGMNITKFGRSNSRLHFSVPYLSLTPLCLF